MERHPAARVGHGRTWAKTILIGEHSVVYGHAAVAFPLHDLEMRATVTPVDGPSTLRSLDYDGPLSEAGPRFAPVVRAFEATREFTGGLEQSFAIETSSDFPHERGLGSSAASAGAIIRAVLDAFGRQATDAEVLALTNLAEQVAHVRPSGLDAATTTSDLPIRFQSGEMRALSQQVSGVLVIADSGIHGSTRDAVAGLRERYEADPDAVGPRINRLGELTQAAIEALDAGDAAALGTAMDAAHAVLAELGISIPALDGLTRAARDAGALGAKLSGGGLGGCVIALAATDTDAEAVRAALLEAGAAQTWTYQMRTSEASE